MNPVSMALKNELSNIDSERNEIESICISCNHSQKVALIESKRQRMVMIDPDAICSSCSKQGRFV